MKKNFSRWGLLLFLILGMVFVVATSAQAVPLTVIEDVTVTAGGTNLIAFNANTANYSSSVGSSVAGVLVSVRISAGAQEVKIDGVSGATRTVALGPSGTSTTITIGAYTLAGDSTPVETVTVVITRGGGGGGGDPDVPVSGFSVSPKTMALDLKGTKEGKVTGTITPQVATNKNVLWKVAPAGIVTLAHTSSESGTPVGVTALAVGTATITGTTGDGNHSDTCVVTVTDNGSGPTPTPPGPTSIKQVEFYDPIADKTYPATVSIETWWTVPPLPAGTDISRLIVVVIDSDGTAYRSDETSFVSGVVQNVPIKNPSGEDAGKILAGVRLSGTVVLTAPTIKERQAVNNLLGILGISMGESVAVKDGDLYINGLSPTQQIIFEAWVTAANAARIAGYVGVDGEGTTIPAAPVVLWSSAQFKIAWAADGSSMVKPQDLKGVLDEFALYKLFDADSQLDLFAVLKPYLDSGVISYNNGTMTVNVVFAVIDGPAPDIEGIERPGANADSGVYYDAENKILLIFDGVADGKIFDPIVLMRKTPASTLQIRPTSVTVNVNGVADVTVTGGSVTWTVADGKIAKIEPTNTMGLYKVTGLAAGATTMTATLDGDPTVKAVLTVKVNSGGGSSSSCNAAAGAIGLGLLALAGVVGIRKRT